MARESFLLVSLKEEKAKKLAQVVSNESCRKILDYLTSKEATETELAERLSLPISTVHYNLRHLSDAGLVVAEEFHYSRKGREVNHYKLANKYIIIAPKTTFGIKEKLRSILPAVLIMGAAATAVHLAGRMGTVFAGAEKLQAAAPEAAGALRAAPLAAPLADEAFMAAVPEAADTAAAGVQAAQEAAVSYPSAAIWFIAGAVAALVLYLLIDYLRSRRR